jgi:hypothetical protein
MSVRIWLIIAISFVALLGCSRKTQELWSDTKDMKDDHKSNSVAIQYLNDGERVAVLPAPGTLHSNQIAVIYRIPKDLPPLHTGVKSVAISDLINVYHESSRIDGGGQLRLEFDNGRVFTLAGTATLVDRSANEILYKSDKISFDRRAFFRGVKKSDFEKVLRVPLTPVAVTMDAGGVIIDFSVTIITAPAWIPLCIMFSGYKGP